MFSYTVHQYSFTHNMRRRSSLLSAIRPVCVWARLSFSSLLETSGGDNCVSALLFSFFGIVGCLSAGCLFMSVLVICYSLLCCVTDTLKMSPVSTCHQSDPLFFLNTLYWLYWVCSHCSYIWLSLRMSVNVILYIFRFFTGPLWKRALRPNYFD